MNFKFRVEVLKPHQYQYQYQYLMGKFLKLPGEQGNEIRHLSPVVSD